MPHSKIFCFAVSISLLFSSAKLSSSPGQQKPGMIGGIVRDVKTSEGLSLVEVKLTGPNGDIHTGITDAAGRFTFPSLSANDYSFSLTKETYARPQKNGGPKTIHLESGSEIKDIELRLLHLGVLAGKVLDLEGNPLAGARIAVYQDSYVDGSRVIGSVDTYQSGGKSALSNDRGEFRLFFFEPGKYYWSVEPEQIGATVPSSTYSKTFFPGTTDRSDAAPIEVTGGENAIGTLQVKNLPRAGVTVSGKIDGTLPSSNVAFPKLVFVSLNTILANGVSYPSEIPPKSLQLPGSFTFSNVPPGSYEVFAESLAFAEATASSSVRIQVGQKDIGDLALNVSLGRKIEGSVVTAGAEIPFGKVRITFAPLRRGRFVLPVDVMGKFILPPVSPDHYRIEVGGLPSDAYVSEIRLGGTPVSNRDLEITGDEVSMQIAIKTDGGSVSGLVRKNRNTIAEATVVLVPKVTNNESSMRYKVVDTGESGKFTLDGVAPGAYMLYAWESVKEGAYRNAEFLSRYQGEGKDVTIVSLQHLNVDLLLIQKDR